VWIALGVGIAVVALAVFVVRRRVAQKAPTP
jgi:hypothetical protein